MEIRRKVFSLLENEEGEERYYSTTEFEIEFDEETGEKFFSEREEDDDEPESKVRKSGRGYYTASRYNGVILGPAAVKAGRKAAMKAEKEGKSESEMIDAAGKKAAKVAGITNAALTGAGAATVGAIYHKVSKNPELRRAVKDAIKDSGASEEVKEGLLKAGKKLGKKGRVGAIAGGAMLGIGAYQTVKGARRAADGARKNVSKGLVKSHKEENED